MSLESRTTTASSSKTRGTALGPSIAATVFLATATRAQDAMRATSTDEKAIDLTDVVREFLTESEVVTARVRASFAQM